MLASTKALQSERDRGSLLKSSRFHRDEYLSRESSYNDSGHRDIYLPHNYDNFSDCDGASISSYTSTQTKSTQNSCTSTCTQAHSLPHKDIAYPHKTFTRPYKRSEQIRSSPPPFSSYDPLPLEYWERSDACREAKIRHMDRIDQIFKDREAVVLLTTLHKEDTVLEKNMFPCKLLYLFYIYIYIYIITYVYDI